MGKEQFRNCFIDTANKYEYSIVINDTDFARARTLSTADRAEIEQNAMTKRFDGKELHVDVNSQKMRLWTVKQALVSWVVDRPLTIENIALLTPDILNEIAIQINAHEAEVDQDVTDNEKN